MDNKEKHQENVELVQLVSFVLGKEIFGIEILHVQEIIRLVSITKVPNAPQFVEGVINLRGRVIPIVDLRVRLGIETSNHNNSTRIIVVELNEMVVGFIVDEVNEVLRIPKTILEPPPPLVGSVDSEYITSVGKLENGLLILIDLKNVLSFDEKKILAEV